jgi:hypothetical protein
LPGRGAKFGGFMMGRDQVRVQSAVDFALARARQHSSTAAVAAALVPLAALLTPAEAVTPAASVTATPGMVNSTPDIAYTVTNNIPNSNPINLIVIPEIHLGDLIFTAAGGYGPNPLPSGWTATQVTSNSIGAGLRRFPPRGRSTPRSLSRPAPVASRSSIRSSRTPRPLRRSRLRSLCWAPRWRE